MRDKEEVVLDRIHIRVLTNENDALIKIIVLIQHYARY